MATQIKVYGFVLFLLRAGWGVNSILELNKIGSTGGVYSRN